MKTTLIRLDLIAAVTAMITLTGCASVTPDLDSRFGTSFNNLKTQQILDPNASNNINTPMLDGAVAVEVAVRYKNSYKTPPATQGSQLGK